MYKRKVFVLKRLQWKSGLIRGLRGGVKQSCPFYQVVSILLEEGGLANRDASYQQVIHNAAWAGVVGCGNTLRPGSKEA